MPLFIAGDIYDRSVPPTEAVRALDEILVQLILGERSRPSSLQAIMTTLTGLILAGPCLRRKTSLSQGLQVPSQNRSSFPTKQVPSTWPRFPYCEPPYGNGAFGDKRPPTKLPFPGRLQGFFRKSRRSHARLPCPILLSRGRKSPLTRSGPLLPVAPVRLPFPYMTLSTIQPWAISMPSSACQTGPFTAGPS